MTIDSSSLPMPSLADLIVTHRNKRFVTIPVSQPVFDGWSNSFYNKDRARTAEITKPLYTKFKDDFDFIVFVLDNTSVPAHGTYGMNVQVSNAVHGIGQSLFDRTADYGSAGRLKSHVTLWSRNAMERGPFLHELCHNWGNYAFATEAISGALTAVSAGGHWGVAGCGGQLGGFDQSTLKTNVDGVADKFNARMPGKSTFGFNANGGNGVPYSDFELYLMGLLPVSELKPFDVFSGCSVDQADVGPWNGSFRAKTRTTYDGDKLTAVLGARVPSFETSQKHFRALCAVLTPSLALSSDVEANIDAQLERMSRPSDDGQWWLNNFWEATRGRGTISFDLSESAIAA